MAPGKAATGSKYCTARATAKAVFCTPTTKVMALPFSAGIRKSLDMAKPSAKPQKVYNTSATAASSATACNNLTFRATTTSVTVTMAKIVVAGTSAKIVSIYLAAALRMTRPSTTGTITILIMLINSAIPSTFI